jgi:hypothetical protein
VNVLSYSCTCSKFSFCAYSSAMYVLYMLRLVWRYHFFPLLDIVVVPVL